MDPFDSVLEFLTLNDEDIDLDPAMELDLLAGGDPNTNPNNPEAQQGQGAAGAGATTTGAPQNVNTNNPPTENNDTTNDAEDDNMEDDTEDDMGGEDDDMGDEDDGSTEDVDTNSGTSNDPDTDRRINLRKLILALINAYSTSIDAMTKSIPPADEALSNKYYNLQEKMAIAKNILYEIATREIYINPYEDSLRRYSALNQLYSICIEYLNTILIKKAPKKERKKNGPSAFANQVKI